MRILRYLLSGFRPVVLGMSALALWLALLASMLKNPSAAWQWLDLYNRGKWFDVNHGMPAFYDVSVITYSAACAKGGGDPYKVNGCDSYWAAHPDPHVPTLDILYNYPPIWLEAFRLGPSPAMTRWAGLALALLIIAALAAIFRPRTPIGGLLTIASVLSPPVLFGLELGNSDLLIFSCLVFVILVTAGLAPVIRDTFRSIVIIVLTVMKLYPVACVLVLARNFRGLYTAIIVAIGAATLTWLSSGERLMDVLHNTPTFSYPTFGSFTALLGISERFGFNISHGRIYSSIAAVVALGFAIFFFEKGDRRRFLPPIGAEGPLRDLAISGLAIYILCFLLGSNLDYRLIFLVGVLPLFIEEYEIEPETRNLICPLAIVSFLWVSRFSSRFYFMGEILDWVIFAVGGAWEWQFVFAGLINQSSVKKSLAVDA